MTIPWKEFAATMVVSLANKVSAAIPQTMGFAFTQSLDLLVYLFEKILDFLISFSLDQSDRLILTDVDCGTDGVGVADGTALAGTMGGSLGRSVRCA